MGKEHAEKNVIGQKYDYKTFFREQSMHETKETRALERKVCYSYKNLSYNMQ